MLRNSQIRWNMILNMRKILNVDRDSFSKQWKIQKMLFGILYTNFSGLENNLFTKNSNDHNHHFSNGREHPLIQISYMPRSLIWTNHSSLLMKTCETQRKYARKLSYGVKNSVYFVAGYVCPFCTENNQM